ncbi:MAG: hypothetical protein ACREDR_00090 [Blastocatellia bacterium]
MYAHQVRKLLEGVGESPPIEVCIRYKDSLGAENTVPVGRVIEERDLSSDDQLTRIIMLADVAA